jgi:glutamate formiminotransferase/formiminotetrahydrofolate cyclodeaminase
MDRIVECVPNFSEGQQPQVVEQICDRIRTVPGVCLLDKEMDPSHNRAVVTFVGPPEAVAEAAFRGVREAAQLIDMRQHRGAHPRVGATDVVPFIPVKGVTMDECVALARTVGERIGSELGIPVYLYEEAAARPDRRNLADVRRGEYEGLVAEIATNPDRVPDYGPAEMGPAGATVVGARPFLVAYNVYLGTADLNVARQIARAVRHSSGGLRFVKALGIAVDRPGQVQVSMNLTDFRRTPIHRVMALIREEAAHYGVPVLESEVVGLLPAEALVDASRYYLQLHHLSDEQILDNRLQAASGSEKIGFAADLPRAFLSRVAAGTATPGGGSVAALAGAHAAALARMVANLTIGKKRYAEVEEEMREWEASIAHLQEELLGLTVQDSEAFNAIMAAYRLPRQTEEEKAYRRQAIQEATLEAARVPLVTAECAVSVLEVLALITARGNINALTDATVGSFMAQAAVHGAAANVRVNIDGLENSLAAGQFRSKIDELEARTKQLVEQIQQTVVQRTNKVG